MTKRASNLTLPAVPGFGHVEEQLALVAVPRFLGPAQTFFGGKSILVGRSHWRPPAKDWSGNLF